MPTDYQSTIPETTWSYLAGFIDGEGCIRINRHYKRTGTKSKRGYEIEPQLTISNMNKRNIEAIQELLHLGNVQEMRYTRKGELASIGYDIRFFPNAQRIIYPKIIPYLIQKKEKAQLLLKLLDFRKSKCSSSEEREKFYLQLEDDYRALVIKERPWLLGNPEISNRKFNLQNTSIVKAYLTHQYVPSRPNTIAGELMGNVQSGEGEQK